MKSISKRLIIFLWITVALGVPALMVGMVYDNKWILLIALGLLLCYFWVYKKKLKCPFCGENDNLQRFTYAMNHPYHCRNCGRLILIEDEKKDK